MHGSYTKLGLKRFERSETVERLVRLELLASTSDFTLNVKPLNLELPSRLERSEALERLERLEQASVCVRASVSPRKNPL